MSDEIVVRYRFDRRLLPRALGGWWRSAMPPAPFIRRVLAWGLIWLGLLMVTLALGAAGIEPVFVVAGLVGAAVLVVWFVVLQRVRMRRFAEIIGSHWDRAGETRATFGPSGAVFATTVTRTDLAWAGVDAIAAVRGATVLRSGVGMLAIPDAALPPGLTPVAFRARLEAWRSAD
jgi:hypothetical protein